jgi:hypothetical protein
MATEGILVEFDFEGKHYKGHLSAPHGAGGSVWFLTVNNYHQGQLMRTANNKWRFYNKKGSFPELADKFSKVVEGSYAQGTKSS